MPINSRILIGIDWYRSALGIDRGSPEFNTDYDVLKIKDAQYKGFIIILNLHDIWRDTTTAKMLY